MLFCANQMYRFYSNLFLAPPGLPTPVLGTLPTQDGTTHPTTVTLDTHPSSPYSHSPSTSGLINFMAKIVLQSSGPQPGAMSEDGFSCASQGGRARDAKRPDPKATPMSIVLCALRPPLSSCLGPSTHRDVSFKKKKRKSAEFFSEL